MQSGSTEPTSSCSNCIQRNTTCDGTEPVCNSCIRSGLFCQGYGSIERCPSAISTSIPAKHTPDVESITMRHVLSGLISNPVWLDQVSDSQALQTSDTRTDEQLDRLSINHPEGTLSPTQRCTPWQMHFQTCQPYPQARRALRSLTLDPRIISNTLPFIISQYVRLVKLIAFRSPPSYLQDGLTLRLKTSNIIYSSMFLGARVFQALLDNFHRTDWRFFTQRIDQLQRQIDLCTNRNPDFSEIEDRLAVIMDLASFKFITSNSASGYALMKHAAPLFRGAARSYPSIWTSSGTISLPDAINSPSLELSRFVWTDNLAALIFGTELFFRYDTAPGHVQVGNGQLEWVYGCPEEFMVFLGRINALRPPTHFLKSLLVPGAWSILAAEITRWIAPVDRSAESCTVIARLAVHECWRHTLLIYLYLAVCRANSADPRIAASVQQIIQLLGTVRNEDYIDRHLFVPCLIAGISSRKEIHRKLVRERVAALSATKIWVLQGADFTSVLDHLWHGPAKDGHPIGWEDYVASRRVVLPVDERPV